jgi:hypothetical protein
LVQLAQWVHKAHRVSKVRLENKVLREILDQKVILVKQDYKVLKEPKVHRGQWVQQEKMEPL